MKMVRVLLVLAILSALSPAAAATGQARSNDSWAIGFGQPGLNFRVLALAAAPDGSIIAGGEFTVAGGAPANYIARWDGEMWHPMGSGMNGPVFALAYAADGTLWAGGSFTQAGGVPAAYVARWTGSAWQPVGGGMDGHVYSLLPAQAGTLYAAGWFNQAGGTTAVGVARWDAANWQPIGTGLDSPHHSTALALGDDGNLYAGGNSFAGVNVYRWNGTQWQLVGNGLAGSGDLGVYDLEFTADGSLLVAGRFDLAGGVSGTEVNGLARWDGAQWHAYGAGPAFGAFVYALSQEPGGALVIGGAFQYAGGVEANGVARWDGAAWQALGSGVGPSDFFPGQVGALAAGQDGSLYAGCLFNTAGGMASANCARWYGGAWRALGDGMSAPVLAISSGQGSAVVAGGLFTRAGGMAVNLAAAWQSPDWQALGTGIGGGNPSVQATAIGADGSLYVGGYFSTAGGETVNCIARWDGAQWQALGSGMGGWDPTVYALAIGPDGALYAGGAFTVAGSAPANGIARWNGSQWSALGSGLTGGFDPRAFDLQFGSARDLYVAGRFAYAGGTSASSIARWDTAQQAWHALGSGVSGGDELVDALAVASDGSVYAGGAFTTAGGSPAHAIARWVPATSTWHGLGSETSSINRVNALAISLDGSLFVGGDFTAVGSVAANHIARWDPGGMQWTALGDGANDAVRALDFGPDGVLSAGGDFLMAGSSPSAYFAQWVGEQRTLGDMNGDGQVTVMDVAIIALAWGLASDPMDMDGDGWTTVRDVQIVASLWD